jgi:hypothetical protein
MEDVIARTSDLLSGRQAALSLALSSAYRFGAHGFK